MAKIIQDAHVWIMVFLTKVDAAGSDTFADASRSMFRPRLLLDDWCGRISIGAEIGVEGGKSGGTWD